MRIICMLLFLSVLSLGGCVPEGIAPAWTYYDDCSMQTSSFKQMAMCGKQRRNASCQAANACSREVNSLVQYADSLVESVDKKEITEADAKRRWIEFKTSEANNRRQAILQAEAIDAATKPVTCNTYAGTTNCF